jgi:hypothetical protein
MMHKSTTIAACWDGGDYYSPDYVNRLYNSCKRNISITFDFVLYVGPLAEHRKGEINPAIKIIQTDLPSWWCGMPLWRKNPSGIMTDSFLYLDLDQVIVGSLDDLINYPSQLCGMKDYPAAICPKGKERDVCVSTMLIRNNSAAVVWDEYIRAGAPTWDASHGHQQPLPMAAQGLVNQYCRPDHFPENWIISYKNTFLVSGIPEDCRIIAFHGQPKQHDCLHEIFVQENWK